jgi:hypothetical protein
MQPARKRSATPAHLETWLLASILAIAALLLAFGLIASEVMEGSTLAFDRHVILAFAAAPIHPTGHHERKGRLDPHQGIPDLESAMMAAEGCTPMHSGVYHNQSGLDQQHRIAKS